MNCRIYYILSILTNRLSATDLYGVITALVTPFDNHSNLDLVRYEELILSGYSGGVRGIVALGTTGESPVLNHKEWISVVEQAVSSSAAGKTVIIGVGTNDTQTTIEKAHLAAKLGADGVLVVTPYYNMPTSAGLEAHFTAIADKSSLPVILYHIPSRCGVDIPVDLTLKLAEHPNIIAIKEAGGDVWRSGEIARQAPDDFAVLSGDDNLTLPLLAVGAVGVISVISNVLPEPFVKMVDFMLSNEVNDARRWHRFLSPILSALSLETNPSPIKEALSIAGLAMGQVRPPLAPVSISTREAIHQAMQRWS